MTVEDLLKEISKNPRKHDFSEPLGIVMFLIHLQGNKLITSKDGHWCITEKGKIKANELKH